jgi:CRISPR-associated protein Cmr1
MADRKTLTVTLETVTPLFLGGAEPRGEPELRPPAFRGALRYWLRAALGGALGDDDAGRSKVNAHESAVFGSTDEKTGGASAVSIRLSVKALPTPQTYKRQPPISATRVGQTRRQPAGRDYLYWSMDKSGSPERGNYQPPKQFYSPGMLFDFILSLRPGIQNAEERFHQAVSALWLLIHFGGIGSRSRRTAGSLGVRGQCEAAGLTFSLSATNVAQAAAQLGAGVSAIRKQFLTLDSRNPHMPSAFDVLHPTVCRLWVLGMWKSWDAAVEAIGSAMRDFRTYREPDHRNVAQWLQGQTIPTVERAAFGLPLPYRYSNGGLSGTVQGRVRQPTLDRRASPLWLKVSKTYSGNYIGVATLFKSAFLPEGEKLYIRTKGMPPPINPPIDYELIEQFIAGSFPGYSEISYV